MKGRTGHEEETEPNEVFGCSAVIVPKSKQKIEYRENAFWSNSLIQCFAVYATY